MIIQASVCWLKWNTSNWCISKWIEVGSSDL